MDRERFTEHLAAPMGRGVVLSGGFDGHAGGALCGDLVRISVVVEGDRVVSAAFDASGCGAVVAAGSAAVTLVSGELLLEAARVGTREIASELGGLSPGKLHAADLAADALHRALGAAARTAEVPFSGRTLVAMSGGVDSAVRRCCVGEDAVTVTLELWRDEDNDAEASCCSADAVRLARSVAHRMGLPHFTLDLRSEFREGVVDPFLAGYAAGETPNPCVGCNGHVRLDAMLDLASRLGCASLATGHYARVTDDGLLRVAADPAKDQTYMLSALSQESLRRMRFPLAELTKAEVRALAARRTFRWPSGRSPRISVSWPVWARRGSWRGTPASGTLAARSCPPMARCSALTTASTTSRSASARASACSPPTRCMSCAPRRPPTASSSARARSWPCAASRSAARACIAPAARSTPCACATTPAPCPAASRAPRTPAPTGLELELSEPFHGAAPGQSACLLRGDVIVGWATISAQ